MGSPTLVNRTLTSRSIDRVRDSAGQLVGLAITIDGQSITEAVELDQVKVRIEALKAAVQRQGAWQVLSERDGEIWVVGEPGDRITVLIPSVERLLYGDTHVMGALDFMNDLEESETKFATWLFERRHR